MSYGDTVTAARPSSSLAAPLTITSPALPSLTDTPPKQCLGRASYFQHAVTASLLIARCITTLGSPSVGPPVSLSWCPAAHRSTRYLEAITSPSVSLTCPGVACVNRPHVI